MQRELVWSHIPILNNRRSLLLELLTVIRPQRGGDSGGCGILAPCGVCSSHGFKTTGIHSKLSTTVEI